MRSNENKRRNLESMIKVAVQGEDDYAYYQQYEWILYDILPILTDEQLYQFLAKLLKRNGWVLQEDNQ